MPVGKAGGGHDRHRRRRARFRLTRLLGGAGPGRALPLARVGGCVPSVGGAAPARHLTGLPEGQAPGGLVVAGYWPIKGEAVLRAWPGAQQGRGAVTALPVVTERDAP
jgi:hypothetical protein